MKFRIFNRRKLIRYVTLACVAVLSLIIVDTLLGQVPQEPQQTEPARRQATNGSSLDTKRINSINERISLLKRLGEEDKRRASENSNQAVPVMPQPIRDSSMPKSPEAESGLNMFDPTGKTADPPVETFAPTLPPANPLAKHVAQAKQVVNQPLDPFELGNSLFMTGNYSASIKSYQTILEGASDNDQVWLRCMMGCNYRLLNNFRKAEEAFREVSNSRDRESFAVDYSRWSLSYIEARRKSKAEFESIAKEIDSALERMKNESERP